MTTEYGRTIVLPPIGPLFANSLSPAANYFAYESEEQRERYEEDMARYFGVPVPKPRTQPPLEEPTSLRTPTSVQPSLLSASFPPSSSPVKKDTPLAKNGAKTTLSQLQLDSPPQRDNGEQEMTTSATHSPVGEEEKLRVSRERNRLHAQRTRIRKRELLESLKERIEALQDEHELLKQAYEFHATAVSLLALGEVTDAPCVQKLDQVGVSATEDRDLDGQLCEEAKDSNESEDIDAELGENNEHEKGCVCHEKDGAIDACTCVGAELNENGKRPYSSSTSNNNLLTCSKEERERVRRERNRLHARRARLRKKLVLEKSQQAVHDLRERNDRLRNRLSLLVSSIYGADSDGELCTSS
ncbi:hypothetical protein BBJ29_006087 [Phytophthora kernoviae]|uniref:BZIP domain-containing protein n=1 Tax=Phytophthora kernoviae TaxID=325452 RepID=A0A3F2RI71_9STRA|nr:hypothetical protein BBJ29_006087 [Phytophthora kernoviae]RLN57590.1 hypothetical protein BBP00_00007436 [Phytophthora kernoviae]